MNFLICKHCGCDPDICGNQRNRDDCRFLKAVQYHRSRARNCSFRFEFCHEPATLTAKEWVETLCDFGWRCAYCRQEKPLEMEHFVPLGWGAGTVKSNCVPSCHKCNTTKSDLHPGLVKKIPAEDMERVRKYLLSILSKS